MNNKTFIPHHLTPHPFQIDGTNMFIYVQNNPVSWTDPFGNSLNTCVRRFQEFFKSVCQNLAGGQSGAAEVSPLYCAILNKYLLKCVLDWDYQFCPFEIGCREIRNCNDVARLHREVCDESNKEPNCNL